MRSIRPDESAAALRRAVALEPEHARARVMLGEMLRASGHYDEAAAEYRHVLAKTPSAGTAWWGLADLKDRKLGEADIDRIRAAMQSRSAGEDDLIAMGFALAKALEDQGRYADSLAALAEAHARARRRQQWDAAGFSGRIDYAARRLLPLLRLRGRAWGGGKQRTKRSATKSSSSPACRAPVRA
jgi:tetratricopeptide (TPR) repeat protein